MVRPIIWPLLLLLYQTMSSVLSVLTESIINVQPSDTLLMMSENFPFCESKIANSTDKSDVSPISYLVRFFPDGTYQYQEGSTDISMKSLKGLPVPLRNGVQNTYEIIEILDVGCGAQWHTLKVKFHYKDNNGVVDPIDHYGLLYFTPGLDYTKVSNSIHNISQASSGISSAIIDFKNNYRIAGFLRSSNHFFTMFRSNSVLNISYYKSEQSGSDINIVYKGSVMVTLQTEGSDSDAIVLDDKYSRVILYQQGGSKLYVYNFAYDPSYMLVHGSTIDMATVIADVSLQKIKSVLPTWTHMKSDLMNYCDFVFSYSKSVFAGEYTIQTMKLFSNLTIQLQSSMQSNFTRFSIIHAGVDYAVAHFKSYQISPGVSDIRVEIVSMNGGITVLDSEAQTNFGIANKPRFIQGSWTGTGFIIIASSDLTDNSHPMKMYRMTQSDCYAEECSICSMTGCLSCPILTKLTHSYLSRCFLPDNIPSGTMIYAEELKDCIDPNCMECSTNASVCTKCNDNPNDPLYLYNSACVKTTGLASLEGLGPDLAAKTIVPCQDTNCNNCSQDYTKCIQCKPIDNLYLDPVNHSCKLKDQITTGYGINKLAGRIETCSVAYCDDCLEDYQICSKCISQFAIIQTPTSQYCTPDTPQNVTLGYGLDTTSSVPLYKQCMMGTCLNCSENYTTCQRCKQSSPYLGKVGETLSCLSQADLDALPKFGVSGLYTYGPCTSPFCSNCSRDVNTCLACGIVQNETQQIQSYMNKSEPQPDKVCVTDTQVPGWAVTLDSSFEIERCKDTHCQLCYGNSSACTLCSSGFFVLPNNTCQSMSQIPNGLGIKNSTHAEACQTANCKNCRMNNQVCFMCSDNFLLQVNESAFACIDHLNPISGWGKVAGSQRVMPCILENCTMCWENFANCSECRPNSGEQPVNYLLETETFPYLVNFSSKTLKSCTVQYLFPPGYGISSAIVKTCDSIGCLECSSTASNCTICHEEYYLVLDTPQRCLKKSEPIPSGWGVFESSNTLKKCSDQNCADCQSDSKMCTQCKHLSGSPLLYPSQGVCYTESTFVAGLGADKITSPATWKLSPCSELGCHNCSQNYKICSDCKENHYLMSYQEEPRCIQEADIKDLTLAYQGSNRHFGISLGSIPKRVIDLCPLNCIDCKSDHTKCQKCADGFLILPNDQCFDLKNPITDGLGRDTVTNPTRLVPCQESNCKNCSDLFTICKECSPSYYLNTISSSSPICQNMPNFPPAFGIDTTSSPLSIKPCFRAGCANCSLNYSECQNCTNTFYSYQSVTGLICYTKQQVPFGLGLELGNPVANTLKQCKVANCKDCFSNMTECSLCDYQLFLTVNKLQCVDQTAIPAGQGMQTGTKDLQLCTQPNCNLCTLDYSKCSTCNSEFRVSESGSCQKCQIEGCLTCPQSSTACSQCLPSYPYFSTNGSQSDSKTCYKSIPSAWGLDLTQGGQPAIKRCSDGNCQNCSTNYKSCSQCNSGFLLNIGSGIGSCVAQAANTSIPPGYGADTDTGMVKPCEVPNCRNCTVNYKVCTNCTNSPDVLLLFNPTKNICQFSSDLPNGEGANLTDYTVVNCSDPNCKTCFNDYTTCYECKDSYRIYKPDPLTVQCITQGSTPPDWYGPDPNDPNSLVECKDKRCLKCPSDFTKCSQCISEYFLYPAGLTGAPSVLSSTCSKYEDIVTGFAISGDGTNSLKACNVACLECDKTKIDLCTSCKPEDFYYQIAGGVKCLGSDWQTIDIEGYGKDNESGNTKLLVPCNGGPNCKYCKENSKVCDQCYKISPVDSSSLVFQDLASNTCIPKFNIPNGFGPESDPTSNPISTALKACSDTNCLNCSTLWNQCLMCKPGNVNHSSNCVPIQDLPDGFGQEPVTIAGRTPKSKQCKLAGCKNCKVNSDICTACNDNYHFIGPTTDIKKCLAAGYSIIDTVYQGVTHGKVSNSSQLVQCSSNCYDCVDDASKCNRCNDMWYLRQRDGLCVSGVPTDFNPGEGVRIDSDLSLHIVPCSDSSCLNCTTNSSMCFKCKDKINTGGNDITIVELRLIDQAKFCYKTSELPAGYGAIPGTSRAGTCRMNECELCNSDATKCSKCKDGSLWYQKGDDYYCYPQSATRFKEPYGRDKSNPQSLELKSCFTTNCEDCAADYTKCTLCPFGMLVNTKTNTCVQNTTQEPGFGIEISSSGPPTLVPCKIPGCAECHLSASLSCTSCGSIYRVEPTGPSLLPRCLTQIPESFGPKSVGSLTLVPCEAYCLSCPTVSSVCTQCEYPFILHNSKCIDAQRSLNRSQGRDTTTGKVASCTDPNCEFCRLNTNNCTGCLLGYLLFSQNFTCLKKDDKAAYPAGYGQNGSYLSKCVEPNCIKCSEDVNFCERCAPGLTLLSLSNRRTCEPSQVDVNVTEVKRTAVSMIKPSSFDYSKKNMIVSFDKLIPDMDYTNTVFSYAFDKNDKKVDGVRVNRIEKAADSRSVRVDLELNTDQEDFNLYMKSKPSVASAVIGRILVQNEDPFKSGVVVSGISGVNVASVDSFESVSLVLTIVLIVASALAFLDGKISGFKMIYYHSLIASLVLPSVIQSGKVQAFLSEFTITLPSLIPLPKVNESSTRCVAPYHLEFIGIDCFVYNNLRRYLILLAVAVLIPVILKIFKTKRKESKEDNEKLTFREKAIRFFNLSFFVGYFVAVMPLWLYFAFLNVYMGATSPVVAFGMMLSFAVILLYIGISVLAVALYRQQKKDKEDNVPTDEVEQRTTIVSSIKRAFVRQEEEDIQYVSKIYIIDLCKIWIYTGFLVFVQTHPLTQSIALTILFGFCLLLYFFMNTYDNLTDLSFCFLVELCITVYFALNSYASSVYYDSFGSNYYQTSFAIGYIIMVCAMICLLLVWLICMIFRRIRGTRKRKTKVAKKKAAPETFVQAKSFDAKKEKILNHSNKHMDSKSAISPHMPNSNISGKLESKKLEFQDGTLGINGREISQRSRSQSIEDTGKEVHQQVIREQIEKTDDSQKESNVLPSIIQKKSTSIRRPKDDRGVPSNPIFDSIAARKRHMMSSKVEEETNSKKKERTPDILANRTRFNEKVETPLEDSLHSLGNEDKLPQVKQGEEPKKLSQIRRIVLHQPNTKPKDRSVTPREESEMKDLSDEYRKKNISKQGKGGLNDDLEL